MQKRILIVIGTRPEAIKMAPVIAKIRKNDLFELFVCSTAQHREMLDQVLTFYGIHPDFDLDVMTGNQKLDELSNKIVAGISKIIGTIKPDLVLVHGDTTTTISAALAAFYTKTKIAHVEAGLRSGNIEEPWPEEANRRLTSVIADYHFAPTTLAKSNLQAENVSVEKIYVTGNTVVDAVLTAKQKIKNDNYMSDFEDKFSFLDLNKKLILVTCHRRENIEHKLIDICRAIKHVAENRSDVEILIPVHLNPNVRTIIKKHLGEIRNVHLIEPQSYPYFVYLLTKAYIVVTDSGGIQEEAPSFNVPVLVLRNVTERPEAIDTGGLKLIGTEYSNIVHQITKLLDNHELHSKMSKSPNPYGDGDAATRILSALIANL